MPKILRICLHSLVLALINLVSVIVAFVVYYLLRQVSPGIDQILVQAPLALLLSVTAFTLWVLFVLRFSRGLAPHALTEWAGVFLGALLWTPAIFIPLHYLTQGYMTSFDNITVTWLFQIPVNLLAVGLALKTSQTAGEPARERTLSG